VKDLVHQSQTSAKPRNVSCHFMKTSIRQTVVFFLLLFFFNLLAGQYNLRHNFIGTFKDVIGSSFGLIFCSILFFISCQIKSQTNLRLYLLPICRTVFWTVIVLWGIIADNRMATEDFLYANNEMFFWWTSLKILTPTLRDFSEIVELILIDILAIAVGQFLIIKAAIIIENKSKNILSANLKKHP